MEKIYGIVFKGNGKIYNFISNIDTIDVDNYVIVETEKGVQLGKVSTIIDINNQDKTQLKDIVRIATEEDYKQYLNNLKLAQKALDSAKKIAEDLNLEMNILNAAYTFDKKQLLINFIANDRIDFRELVKELAAIYHTRIELRQIGVRDKAKEIGGIGQCGRELCCSKCIKNLDSVTINMAKNQNIALNPNKINGACGRLLCCLTYEDDEYTRCKKNLPNVGEYVTTEYGKGKVVSVDILRESYKVDIDSNIYEINKK